MMLGTTAAQPLGFSDIVVAPLPSRDTTYEILLKCVGKDRGNLKRIEEFVSCYLDDDHYHEHSHSV